MKLLGFGTAVLAFCQMFGQMTPHGPAFEVASVKRAVQPGGRGAASSVVDPGRIYYASTTLRYLLIQAYGVKGSQISGPSWMDTEQYDVAAKVPEGAPETQIPAMLQNLLAERFRMTVRRETQVQPAYVLLVDKNGPRLRSSENAGEPNYGARIRGDVLVDEAKGITLNKFADRLTGWVRRPVFDLTDIKGAYDITLELDLSNQSGSIFSAVKNLGLVLQSRDMPVERIVVETAEKTPTEN